ncbi:MAG TPA: DUF2917 domain-containing protein [Burkholderiales bacterium]|nr:DUF2917 domain-containing protein [Burkholderiales bacterium]
MSGEFAMGRGAVLRIEDQPGTTIRVCSGALWVTQQGDVRDHYLIPGQSFTVDRDGTALATAMHSAWVSVTPPPRRESRAQRLVRLLAGLALARA